MARTRKWGLPKTLAVAGIAGIGHVGTSVILSLIAMWTGAALAYNFASVAEIITGWAMIFFGAGFAMFAFLKGGHSHHGIPIVNKIFNIDNRSAEELMHVHDIGYNVFTYHHAYEFFSHDHLHSHSRERGTTLEAGYGLVAIIALTPCIILMPLALRTGEMGIAAVVSAVIVFFFTTLSAILILVAAVLTGLEVIQFEFFEKFTKFRI